MYLNFDRLNVPKRKADWIFCNLLLFIERRIVAYM